MAAVGYAPTFATLGTKIGESEYANAVDVEIRALWDRVGGVVPRPIVLLAMGQSNINNTPAFAWSPPANLVEWNWDGTQAGVGTAFAALGGTTIGIAQARAARVAIANPDARVYLIRLARGSQAIEQWLAGAASSPPTTYDMWQIITNNVPPALVAAGATKVNEGFWWGGESDVNDPVGEEPAAGEYETDFGTFHERLKGEDWWDEQTPIALCTLTTSALADDLAQYDTFNEELERTVLAAPDTRRLISVNSLPAEFWDPSTSPSNVHMIGAGYYAGGLLADDTLKNGFGRDLVRAGDVDGGDPIFNTVRGSKIIRLANSYDLDDLAWEGRFLVSAPTNGPIAAGFWLIDNIYGAVVIGGGSPDSPRIMQIAARISGSTAAADLHVRSYDATSWTGWSRIMTAGAPLIAASYSNGTLPSASSASGQVAYVTNGDAGAPCLAVSNGSVWLRVPLDAVTASAFTALTDAATIAWNAQTIQRAQVTLGGNRTLGAPTNTKAGAVYTLIVKQDGTGGRTLAFNAVFKFPGGTVPHIPGAASDFIVLEFVSDGTNLYSLGAKEAFTTVMKTADQTKTSTTSLAADTALVMPMQASTKYAIRGRIFIDTVAAADFKWRHVGPASPTLVRVHRRSIIPGGTADQGIAVDTAYSAADLTLVGAGTDGGWIEFDAIIHNGANAGNFEVHWAQNTSDVGSTIVRAGSYLDYRIAG